MTSEFHLRRKWTLRSAGHQVVFIKNRNERAIHVYMKALLWALYLPKYPGVQVETRIGDRYKPDLVAVDETGRPKFWAEAGHVSPEKLESLLKRYRDTHFVLGKWGEHLGQQLANIKKSVQGIRRNAPLDVIGFPSDSEERFIDSRGEVSVNLSDVTLETFAPKR